MLPALCFFSISVLSLASSRPNYFYTITHIYINLFIPIFCSVDVSSSVIIIHRKRTRSYLIKPLLLLTTWDTISWLKTLPFSLGSCVFFGLMRFLCVHAFSLRSCVFFGFMRFYHCFCFMPHIFLSVEGQ